MGLLTDGEGGEGKKIPPRPKICHAYSTIMKLGTVIPYLEKIYEYMNLVTHLFVFADISTFLPEISKFCNIKNTDTDCISSL